MLMHPILDRLQTLRFFGMLSALEEQMKFTSLRNSVTVILDCT